MIKNNTRQRDRRGDTYHQDGFSRQKEDREIEIQIERHYPDIYKFVLKRCKNIHDADELTQETFLRAIANLESFEKKSSFYFWLLKIASNLIATHQKRRIRLNCFFNAQYPQYICSSKRYDQKDELHSNYFHDPYLKTQRKEFYRDALMSLEALDHDHKKIIILRDIQGLGYNAIAQVLNINAGTVKSRLSRARKNFRENMFSPQNAKLTASI